MKGFLKERISDFDNRFSKLSKLTETTRPDSIYSKSQGSELGGLINTDERKMT